jgi:hypothetical protein
LYEETAALLGSHAMEADQAQPEEEQDLDEKPAIFKIEPEQFSSEIEYTRAAIRHVRRAHQIDDRLENARRESISRNFTTTNVFPSSFSSPLTKGANTFQDYYFIKAMVPVCKTTFKAEFSRSHPTKKPTFKRAGEPAPQEDPLIFGVLTAMNNLGQIPPVQICE